jgi:hypothetical protein
MKRPFIFAMGFTACLFFISLFVTIMRGHWWREQSDRVIITVNDQPAPCARFYTEHSGHIFLFRIPQGCASSDSEQLYAYDVSKRAVALPNASNHYFIPGYAFIKNLDGVQGIDLASAKAEGAPLIRKWPGGFSFNSSRIGTPERRIAVTLRNATSTSR